MRVATAADAPAIHALEAIFPSDRMSLRGIRRLLRAASAAVWLIPPAPGLQPAVAARGALVMLTRRNSRCARIYSLAVHPQARGRGLAQALVGAAEREARRRGCTVMGLEVGTGNAPARSLYARLGYREQRRLPAYYEDGSDGLRLVKQLSVQRPVD